MKAAFAILGLKRLENEQEIFKWATLAVAGQPEKALQSMTSAKATFAKLGLKRLENEAERLISRITHTKESREKGE